MKKRRPRAVQNRAAIAHALSTISTHLSERFGTPMFPQSAAEVEGLGSGINALMSATETAKSLGVSTKTLANWRTSGTVPLPFVKVGSRVFYRPDDVHAFLLDKTKTSTSER